MKAIRILLFPFSLIFGTIVTLRNFFYNNNILTSSEFDAPVISVGNLTVGGTGKTPHIEYLIRLLEKDGKIATLSRGYKRSTRDYIEATTNHNSIEIGDEPMQFKQKFEDAIVAVDHNRVRGVMHLLSDHPNLNAILLDDAFQHRAIKPGFSILLTDYNHPYFSDFFLPTGNLREWKNGANRANTIIVTKTPEDLSANEMAEITRKLRPKKEQNVYFSYIKYGAIQPVFKANSITKLEKGSTPNILLITGIANATPLLQHLDQLDCNYEHLEFPDHHTFSKRDIQEILKIFGNFAPEEKIVLTTEKDAMRFLSMESPNELERLPVYYIEIQVDFHKDRLKFNKEIEDYVRENQYDLQLPEK
jgi:tetraacyldisaccharide 4'-kinase